MRFKNVTRLCKKQKMIMLNSLSKYTLFAFYGSIEVNYLRGSSEIDRQPIKAVRDIVYYMKLQFARHGIPRLGDVRQFTIQLM